MEALTAIPVLILVVFGLVFSIFFVIWPIVLVIQCLFDKRPSVLYKILTLVLTFTPLYPIPSFVYGAFIRKGFMSVLALISIAFFWIAIILGFIFATGMMFSLMGDVGNFIDKTSHNVEFKSDKKVEKYTGSNTYDPDNMNVFEDGKRSNR